MAECGCTYYDTRRCPRPDHNPNLTIVACTHCGREWPSGRRRCRCGNQYALFVRTTTLAVHR